MRALMIVSLLTFALAGAAQAKPSHQYPGYPDWASEAFEPKH
jgi:hypothetical protein